MSYFRYSKLVLVVMTLSGIACEHDGKQLPKASAAEHKNAPSVTSEPAATRARTSAEAAPGWPDGWVIVSEDEWIPVLDDAGRALSRARTAFEQGDRKQAAEAIRAASRDIQATKIERGEETSQRAKVVSDLDGLASRLEGSEPMSVRALDRALARAYRSHLTIEWMHLSADSWTPIFERPAGHFQSALAMLHDGRNAEAADEIRRGEGFFMLAAQSARPDDHDLLMNQAKELSSLASRADEGTLKEADLRKALVRIDNAYAESYLHQAETSWLERQSADAARALREALARMRASARWLGSEGEAATVSLMADLDKLGKRLESGLSVTNQELKAAIERARAHLRANGPEKPSSRGE